MIEIYRPKVNRGGVMCKACGKKILVAKDTIKLDPHNRILWEQWSFHNECFAELRTKMNNTNIYKVKEK